MANYLAAAFDMDGTVIYGENPFKKNEILASGRLYVLDRCDELKGTCLSEQGKIIIENLKDETITRSSAVKELEILTYKVPLETIDDEFYSKVPIRDGFKECTQCLNGMNIRSLLLTMGDRGVASYIWKSNFMHAGSVSKTDEEKLNHYQQFCNSLKIPYEQTICIGDGPHDFFSDKALKIKMLREDKKQNFEADFECWNFYEVIDIIKSKHSNT